ncbi:MAG TPA: ABC transporter permease [Bryobacteraceae bacterium]|nr:ABC transporter permease [Bryobacteraceae bacterium]
MQSLRSLAKRPAVSLVIIATLALGIGANSAIFSVIDAVLLKPLPYPDSERLMTVHNVNPGHQEADAAPPQVEDWNRLNHTFESIAAFYVENESETGGQLPERLTAAITSPRYFQVLGVLPQLGRTFSAAEERFGGPKAVVISHRLWQRRFNASPDVIGKRLVFARWQNTIVGVMPPSFRFPQNDVDIWLSAQFPDMVMRARESRWYAAIGRLKAGVPRERAEADLAAVQNALGRLYPATDSKWGVKIDPLKEQTVAGVRRSLWILFGGVTLVLLIACANVAAILLAQATRRARDIAIRFSLGAARSRVIKELLVEAFVLALIGSGAGLMLASWGMEFFRMESAKLPRAAELHLDWRIVLFTLLLTVLTTVLSGLVPALHATRTEIAGSLAAQSRTQIGGRASLQKGLVSAQIAIAAVLLVASGLLLRSLELVTHVSPGFDPSNVLTFRISASWGETVDMPAIGQRHLRTLAALRALPGVRDAAVATGLPGSADAASFQFHIAGRDTETEGNKVMASIRAVSPDYFKVVGIPFLSGATCLPDPKRNDAIVNRRFAGQFFGERSPIGEHITASLGQIPLQMSIVGVVADSRELSLTQTPSPMVYLCGIPSYNPDPNYLVKTAVPPMQLAETIRREVLTLSPNRAVFSIATLEDSVSDTYSERRFQSMLFTAFGSTALLLAAIGLYGVMSYFVSQRTREIGLRVALGARPAQVARQVARHAATITVVGLIVGMLIALTVTRFIQSLLFGIGPMDPVTFIAVPLVLASIASLASLIPARRAVTIDPMHALRQN